jgi:serine/threonine protein kinase
LLVVESLSEPYAVGEQIREYKIVELMSQSEIESVYRTRHTFLDEERSFKIIHFDLANDAGYRDRFIHEARLFSKLRHKNLVRLFEFGSLDENTFFVVFEFVDGESVTTRIKRTGRIPYWDAIRIIREAADGLQLAHKQNLIHNNISADNLILITTPEGNEITKLIDFSLARRGSTDTNSEEGDQRSDIYSLGATLYHMIQGEPLQTAEFDDLANVPSLLNRVLRKTLSTNENDRYPTLLEFVRDLNRVPPPDTVESWHGETINLEIPEEFPAGFQLAKRYVIEKTIGKGGMGTVYRARDKVLNVPVALKGINKNITNNQRMVERLKREVILARKVAHPNVCRIYDIGQAGGQHYVTMEYLEGKTLADILSEQRSLSTDIAIPMLKQLFLGLAEAHRVGVIHRDLKPENIMVDTHGRAFIMDFGISISDEVQKLTESGIVVGTPWYMSPEQFSTSNVDARSDLYSMGIIMFEIFTGRLPYDAETPATVMNAHVEGPMFKPSAVGDVHPNLEKVILKAMARDPADRYQNVAELLTDLEAMEGTPYSATLVIDRLTLIEPTKSFSEPPPIPPAPTNPEPQGWRRLFRFFKR